MSYTIKRILTQEDMQAIERLEKRYYAAEYVVGSDESWEWQKRFPFQQAVMLDGQRIIGLVEMYPVKKAMVEGYLSGTFSEQDISQEHMVDVYSAAPGTYAMLLCTIIVEEEYRGQGILKELFREMVDFYDEFEEKGIVFDQLIADAVSEAGRRFMKKIGLELKKVTDFNSCIYMGDYSRFKRLVREAEL